MSPRRPSGKASSGKAQELIQIRAQLRAAEERADDAEYLANLTAELGIVGDSRVIGEHVAGRLQQLTRFLIVFVRPPGILTQEQTGQKCDDLLTDLLSLDVKAA